MKPIYNLASKIFANTPNDGYSILTYIDIDEVLSKEFMVNYITELITANPILTQTIVKQNNQLFINYIPNFDINKCVQIKYTNKKDFNIYIKSILNKSFTEYKFYVLVLINKKRNKSRIFFKIHHSYVDGYKLINMLIDPLYTKKEYELPSFKRNTNSWLTYIYYLIIGTITLIITNVIIILHGICFSNNNTNENHYLPTDYICFKSFSLSTIKKIAQIRNISVNDFLYALMVKTDHLYTQKERVLYTTSPINVTNLKENNNTIGIFNWVNNSHDPVSLFKIVNNTFNNYKYSLFIQVVYIIFNIITHIPIDILSMFFNKIIHNIDYVYTNIIGPSTGNIPITVSNIHFLVNPRYKEIIYNIISCNDNINIICSFKKGVIKNKKIFKKCLYNAYNTLINTDT